MKRTLFFHIIIILIFHTMGFAGDTGKIAGKIIDVDSKEPLAGSNIIIEKIWQNNQSVNLEFNMGAATDENGEFYILNIPPGVYDISCSFIGYKTELRTRVRIFVDKTTILNFELKSDLMESDEITVVAFKEEEVEVDVTATKQVYSIADVEAIAGVASIANILELQADVVDDHFRGGREGEAQYILGGGAIVNPVNNSRAFNPIVTGLEQVEVYTSGFSAEYGNAQSGVVNMVTKEGTNKWVSRLESSVTLPYYKTWNESPYDPENLHFYNALRTDLEEWLKDNPTDPGKPLFDASYGFISNYLRQRNEWPPNPLNHDDTLHIAAIGQAMWMMSMQDVGMEFENTMDHRLDFSAGGPIHDNTKFFVAARQNTEYTVVPTTEPDMERQVMMNLTYQEDVNNKFKFSYIIDNTTEQVFDSNYLRWLFDRTLSVSKYNSLSMQYAFEWKHLFSNSTYMDLKVNLLDLEAEETIDLIKDNEFIEDYRDNTNWTDYNRGPSGHFLGKPKDDIGVDKSVTTTFDGSISSQVDQGNLLKAGFQFSYYDVDIKRKLNISSPGTFRNEVLSANPYEGAFYVQDKMEFKGFIANLGLRYDFYDLQAKYFSNQYDVSRGNFPEADKDAGLFFKLQPRIGFSFPVSEKSVFHLNYGTFTQRAPFTVLYYNQANNEGIVDEIGNPNIKPEKTLSYDIGFVQALPFGFRADISAYYKDVKDLIEQAYYEDLSGGKHSTFINRDYADIKGFHLSIEKTTGEFQGYARYNWESATGKSSNALAVPVYFNEDPDQPPAILPDPEDVYLDYDRTHKFIFNLRYGVPEGGGFEVFDMFPLERIRISTTYRHLSGRPYTYDIGGLGLKYNKRTPIEKDLRIRFQKSFKLNDMNIDFYVEGYNLLNERWYQYSRVFDSSENTSRYHNELNELFLEKDYLPYATDRSVYILRNNPRHYRMGFVFKI